METKNLYFQHSDGSLTLVRANCPHDDVYDEIYAYVKQLNPKFEIHYIRTWGNDIAGYTYDVGSHTEFFYWKEG